MDAEFQGPDREDAQAADPGDGVAELERLRRRVRKLEKRELARQMDHRCGTREDALLKAVADHIVDGVIAIDATGIILSFNPAAERIFGYRSAEVVGRNISMLIRREDASRHDGYLAAYMRSGRSGILGKGPREIVARHKNGGDLYLELAIGRIDTAEGPMFIGSLRDITARREEATALRESEEKFRDIARAASDWFWELGADRRYKFISGSVTERLGVDSAWYAGRSHDEVVAKYFNPEDWRPFDEAFAKRLPFRDLVFARVSETGRRNWIRTSGVPFFDANGEFRGYRGTTTDITELVLAERAFEESEAARTLFLNAVDHLSESVALYGPDERLVAFNRQYRNHAGAASAYLKPGLLFEDYLRLLAKLGELHHTGDELEHWIAGRLASFRDPGEAFISIRANHQFLVNQARLPDGSTVISALEISKQRAVEEQLRRSQRLEAIGKLTGGMAHDFNNYLGVVIGNLEMLQESQTLAPESARYLAAAIQGGVRASDLIRSLLAFARQQPLDPRPTAINRRILSIANLLERTLREDIVVHTELADAVRSVRIDGAQLESCILNLATNARDAMPQGGSLVIRTGNLCVHDEEIRPCPGMTAGEYVLLEVTDTGMGMSADVIARVFEPFFTTKQSGHGTGLGLSMVYGFVKQSGGFIGIDSEPGAGTTVRIYFPCVDLRASPDDPPDGAAVPAGRRGACGVCTILVVEDNPGLRKLATRMLASLGYRTVESADGAEAARILTRTDIGLDAVFTDIVMPGAWNGYALARHALECRPGIKVLLTSGFHDENLNQDSAHLPDLPLLRKPYQRKQLEQALGALLG